MNPRIEPERFVAGLFAGLAIGGRAGDEARAAAGALFQEAL